MKLRYKLYINILLFRLLLLQLKLNDDIAI